MVNFVIETSVVDHSNGNMGGKTPISFNLRKYVEKHCNGP